MFIDSMKLYGLKYVPYKGPYAYFSIYFIYLFNLIQHGIHFPVVDNGKGGGIHFRPGVRSHAGIAGLRTTPVNSLPFSKTSYFQPVEHVINFLGMGLVIYYKYCFHIFISLIRWFLPVRQEPFYIIYISINLNFVRTCFCLSRSPLAANIL